ncbi:archease [Saccharopolyspora phatthalungensis]|uniref:SHS2 domain-containing protein n=1 Tax=Saccharopolyspora phatthalungensis TaxID=664693 RepID=A0A840QGS2_9PSEU|nr:archease [Saccharopolyspora phatthalungensis]MBB5157958.1 SHS2 domain-containing protein [Saccharopolyspora phatthalungensis]
MSGFRFLPHTADIRFEAWGSTRAECLAEAARALVASFAQADAAEPASIRTVEFDGTDEQLLLAVLDEIIYRLDAEGSVPLAIGVRPRSTGGIALDLASVAVAHAELTGATPKAVALHELQIGEDERGWRCAATIDV